jgi:hypothetical protein
MFSFLTFLTTQTIQDFLVSSRAPNTPHLLIGVVVNYVCESQGPEAENRHYSVDNSAIF